MTAITRPPRIDLAPGLSISRMVTGLWQVADQERDRGPLDRDAAAKSLAGYAAAGFDTFDMADHYGTSELITGRFLEQARARGEGGVAFTKWCPEPGPMTREIVRAGIADRCERLGVKQIDLLQFHWWTYQHPAYIDAMRELVTLQQEGTIRLLGTTNFNTDHLRVLTAEGIRVATNQVCFSVLDRRAADDLSAFCLANGIRLVAYGTLAGGLLSERWLGIPEPQDGDISDWSKMKYRRFIDAIGGWDAFQTVLQALSTVARRHGVSIANVATRWVLDQPAVAAVIVGARLGEREHRADNLRCFTFAFDAQDRSTIDAALKGTKRVAGDCGDEYRRAPYLTASGDLSHHLDSLPKVFSAQPVPGRPDWQRVDTGSVWEPLAGYSRAIRAGDRILVSGTTATHGSGQVIGANDVAAQTVYILDKIEASLNALGGSRDDVVRTRIYLRDAKQWEPVARVHGRYFGDVRPANTLIEVSGLIGEGYAVEIEAEAIAPATV